MCQALNQNPWSKILVLGPAVCQDENEMSFLLKDDLTEWENQEDVTDICESDADCPLSQYCLPCVTTLEECQNCPNRYWIPEM